ncbi:hypothetical protein BCR32DRAFT_327991 [Anaeromyces robustus]|uniref:Carbohydrate binding module family 25 domain-containing protein n=1 Tax=Anaeromyces robustus TaxID=1754192 RepID=A0A1Y1X1R6_9FUNG|nr:hypothetical protein BCR32DRAFT_327991 [Anaeromyces robustus]|eukprot:ORX79740.1 hypothetical protein BCR32DRAFT_327991 [Anaeromyces robustus]
MNYKQNKIIFFFIVFLIQNLFVISAPLVENVNKRSFTSIEETHSSIYFEKPSHWGEDVYAYVYSSYVNELPYDAGIPLKQWPGEKMYHDKERNNYNVNFAYKYFNHNSHVMFTDGKNQIPGVLEEGFTLIERGVYNENGLKAVCDYGNTCKKNYALLFYVKDPSWKKVIAHYQIGGKGEWEDTKVCIYDLFQKKYHHTFDLGNDDYITIAFTDGNGKWDNNNGKNYRINALEDIVIVNPNAASVPSKKRTYVPQYIHTTFNVYFEKPSHWGDEIFAYVYDFENDSTTEGLENWPGRKMALHIEEEIELNGTKNKNNNNNNKNNNTYFVTYYRPVFTPNARIIFSDGKNQSPGVLQEGFPLVRRGLYTENGIKAICVWSNKLSNNNNNSYVQYNDCRSTYAAINYASKEDWGFKAYAHYQIGNGQWTKKPVEMQHQNYDTNEFVLYVDVGKEKDLTVAFFDGDNEWDNNNGKNFKVQPLTDVLIQHTI